VLLRLADPTRADGQKPNIAGRGFRDARFLDRDHRRLGWSTVVPFESACAPPSSRIAASGAWRIDRSSGLGGPRKEPKRMASVELRPVKRPQGTELHSKCNHSQKNHEGLTEDDT
jgi:hypothetical protein